jgi:DNA invertase Pin-like site-specific DNA recombinase
MKLQISELNPAGMKHGNDEKLGRHAARGFIFYLHWGVLLPSSSRGDSVRDVYALTPYRKPCRISSISVRERGMMGAFSGRLSCAAPSCTCGFRPSIRPPPIKNESFGRSPSAWAATSSESNKDHGISGAKGRDKRPQFDALCRDATQRQFDLIMAWSVDRLGRSLQDLVGFLSEIHALKIDLYLHQQGLDTTTPAGKAMFQMMGVFSEFERAMIQERVRAGLARARDEGKTLGRPRIDQKLESAIRRSLTAGVGIGKTARTHSVGTATVQRIKAELIG